MSEESSSDGLVGRRRVLQGAVVAAAAAGGGIGVLSMGADRAAASATITGLTASDVSITSNDGTVSTLTLDPNLTIDWQGFDPPVDRMRVMVRASYANTTESNVASENVSLSSQQASGSQSVSPGKINLLTPNGGVLDPATLADSTEGDGPKSTDVEVRVFVRLIDENNNVLSPIPSESATFSVDVTNDSATASITGTLNTNGT